VLPLSINTTAQSRYCKECLKGNPPLRNTTIYNKKRLLCVIHYREFRAKNRCLKHFKQSKGGSGYIRKCQTRGCGNVCNKRKDLCDPCYMSHYRASRRVDGKRRKISLTNTKRIEDTTHLQGVYENGIHDNHRPIGTYGPNGTMIIPPLSPKPQPVTLLTGSQKEFPKGTIAEMILGCTTKSVEMGDSMIEMVKSITIPKVGSGVGVDVGPRLRQACLYFVMSSSLPPMLVS
jgi:hypothetical protein